MSTYSEQDCLDKIAQMKTWRTNAGTALENKGVIQDASNLLLGDMPPYIQMVGSSLYARFDKAEYTCKYQSTSTRTFTVNIYSNTNWTLSGDCTFSQNSGTGNATITAIAPASGSYPTALSYCFKMYLESDGGKELAIVVRRPA